MARMSTLNHVCYNFLAFAMTISLAIGEAEGKGGGKGSGSSSKSGSSFGWSGSASTTTRVKDASSGVTRCYNDKGVEITCPPTNAQIAGYAVAGLAGVLLLIALGYTIRDKFSRRRRALKADDRDLEEDKENQQMLDHGKDGAGEDSDSSDAPPPRYTAYGPKGLVPLPVGSHANDWRPSGSAITPPIISFPAPESSQSSLSLKPPMSLSMPVTTTARKNTLADMFKNVFKRAT